MVRGNTSRKNRFNEHLCINSTVHIMIKRVYDYIAGR
uniref:Uncharacterized protein n=1 Tax=Arundo donax TaxID=35708 RepID=A0A0A9HIM5_ARUDO